MPIGVLGPDRPHDQSLTIRHDPVFRQFDRVRGDREPATVIACFAQTQPGIRRQDTIRVDDQRIEFQFGYLGKIDDQLADPHQRLGDRFLVGRRVVAEPRQRRRGSCAPDQTARERQIERRQISRDVAGDVGGGSALTEADNRTERRVVLHPDAKLSPADRLALHQQRWCIADVPRGDPSGGGHTSVAPCRSSARPPDARASGRTF